MFEPQDLPGRFGRTVRAVDHVLGVTRIDAVVAGGWAVWRHGFIGRVTEDLDIVVGANHIEEFIRVAGMSGFEVVPAGAEVWPKIRHKETGINVDILPEGGRPGVPSSPAPTTIAPPSQMGAGGAVLRYIQLPSLIELKIAAGRARDESDVVELLRANSDQLETIRAHLSAVHADYVAAFERMMKRALDQQDA